METTQKTEATDSFGLPTTHDVERTEANTDSIKQYLGNLSETLGEEDTLIVIHTKAASDRTNGVVHGKKIDVMTQFIMTAQSHFHGIERLAIGSQIMTQDNTGIFGTKGSESNGE